MPNNIANKLASRQLFRHTGLPASSHSLLRENLEHYNSQLSSPIRDVVELNSTETNRPKQDDRWLRKLKRDISKPYSNQDAAKHQAKLNKEMGELKSIIKTDYPGQLFVVGGITKGRFGGNSDYDVVGRGFMSDAACQELADQGWHVWTHYDESGEMVRQSAAANNGVNAEFFSKSDFSKAIGFFGKGPKLDLSSSSNSQLNSLIEQGYRAKGLQTDFDGTALHIADNPTAKRQIESTKDFPEELRNSAKVKTWKSNGPGAVN